MLWLWHEVLRLTGVTNLLWYNWWSAFFADLTIFAGVFVLIFHRNCSVRGCHSVLRTHEVKGTHWRACRLHHPGIDETQHVTPKTIADDYRAANPQ